MSLRGDDWPTVVDAFKLLSPDRGDGHRSVTFQHIDTDRWNRLALIITRLDSAEDVDPHGTYTLVLEPSAD